MDRFPEVYMWVRGCEGFDQEHSAFCLLYRRAVSFCPVVSNVHDGHFHHKTCLKSNSVCCMNWLCCGLIHPRKGFRKPSFVPWLYFSNVVRISRIRDCFPFPVSECVYGKRTSQRPGLDLGLARLACTAGKVGRSCVLLTMSWSLPGTEWVSLNSCSLNKQIALTGKNAFT